MIRGTAQNPDVYFTGRETVNKYYNAVPAIIQETMDKLAGLTGRQYHLFDYHGAPDAEKRRRHDGFGLRDRRLDRRLPGVQGQKVGLVIVRLYRPFDADLFVKALPATVKGIAVLDRTKEPGSLGEPMYEDVRTAIGEAMIGGKSQFKDYPKIVGGRYGLGSAEFTPAMAKAVLDNLKQGRPEKSLYRRYLRRCGLYLPSLG